MKDAFTVDRYFDEPTWLAARRNGVGASESAALVVPGYQWQSPYGLYVAKVADKLAARKDTMSQRMGKAFESAILAEFERSEGLIDPYKLSFEQSTIFRNSERPWLTCSPDAWAPDEKHGLYGVDAKNVSSRKADEWEDGAAPVSYIVQCQHSMAVTGWARWFLAVAIGGNEDFKVVCVPRHDAFIDRVLLPAIDAFWTHVQLRVAPDMDGTEATRAAVAALYPEDDGAEITLPPESLVYHSELVRLSTEAEALAQRADLNRYMLKALIGDASVGWLPNGAGGYSNKMESRKEHVVAASVSRRLRFIKQKDGA